MTKESTAYTRERVIALIESEYESDAAFEREMDLAPKTVNNWRRGRSASFMKMLPRLAEDFDVSISELLDVPIHKDASDLSDDEMEILTLYRKTAFLAPKQRIALAKTLRSLINLYLESSHDKSKRSKGELPRGDE